MTFRESAAQVAPILAWSAFVFASGLTGLMAVIFLDASSTLWFLWLAVIVLFGLPGAAFCSSWKPESSRPAETRFVAGYVAVAPPVATALATLIATSASMLPLVGALIGALATIPYAVVLSRRGIHG